MNQAAEVKKNWKPEKMSSSGAKMYHDAVINADWNLDNLEILAQIFKKINGERKIVVDFGAGTGASSIHLKKYIDDNSELWLADNSPSWLGIAYELLKNEENIKFFIIEKTEDSYKPLSEVIGANAADIVLSANTFHLISDLNSALSGIYKTLKPGGSVLFQSGNILRKGREKDILMIDSTIEDIHSIAIDLIKNEERFQQYKVNIDERIDQELEQRKLIFPSPRPIERYVEEMERVGFKNIHTTGHRIHVNYEEWRRFLGVKRIQAGILPEVGGRVPTDRELKDRMEIIDFAVDRYFETLKCTNTFSNESGFTAEWIYIQGEKPL